MLLQQLETADEAIEESLDRVLEKIKNGDELTTLAQPMKVAKTRMKPQTPDENVMKKRKKVSELLDASDEEADTIVKKKPKIQKETAENKPVKTIREKAVQRYETKDEREALEYYNMMKASRRPGAEVEGASSEEDMKELRAKGKAHDGDDSSSEDEGEGDLAGRGDEDDEEGAVGKRGITKQILKNRGLTPHRNKANKNPRVKHRKKFRKAKIRRRGAVREYRPETTKYGGELSGIRAGVKKSIKLK